MMNRRHHPRKTTTDTRLTRSPRFSPSADTPPQAAGISAPVRLLAPAAVQHRRRARPPRSTVLPRPVGRPGAAGCGAAAACFLLCSFAAPPAAGVCSHPCGRRCAFALSARSAAAHYQTCGTASRRASGEATPSSCALGELGEGGSPSAWMHGGRAGPSSASEHSPRCPNAPARTPLASSRAASCSCSRQPANSDFGASSRDESSAEVRAEGTGRARGDGAARRVGAPVCSDHSP